MFPPCSSPRSSASSRARPARRSPPPASPTSSSSGATTSASRTSAPTRTGLMGYQTPNIDRVAKEGMIFTDYYAEQSCTAGRASFITGQHGLRTGLTKVGLPGATPRAAEGRPDDRRAAQAARLRHRPVRQEPPRRPQRVPAHGPRVRRVLRQPLPPERRGRAGAARLPEGPGVPSRSTAPAACSTARRRTRTTPTVDPRFGKVGKQTIKDTGPLTKKRMETIDDDIAEPGRGLHPAADEGRQAVLRLGELHPHAPPHAPEAGEPRPGRAAGRASTTTR